MEYNIVLMGTGFDLVIDWGNSPGWLEKYASELERAEQVTIFPKSGQAGRLPVVTVKVPPRSTPVIKRRTYGRFSELGSRPVEIHCYLIGYTGEDGEEYLWVYPNGTIESAREPSFVADFLNWREAQMEMQRREA